MCKKCSYSLRINFLTDQDRGWTISFEVLILILVLLTTSESYDLCCYIRTELLLAGAALDLYIIADLRLLEAYELQWCDISSLVKELIEGVLTIGSWLTSVPGCMAELL